MPEQLFYNSVGPAHNYDPRTQDSILLWHDSAIMWSTNVHHSGRCRRVVSHNFWGWQGNLGGKEAWRRKVQKRPIWNDASRPDVPRPRPRSGFFGLEAETLTSPVNELNC